jgi:hypothetical protein
MPVSYYLLKPVKRVTDYPTFIEKLLKNTNSSHPDWGQLNEALNRWKCYKIFLSLTAGIN